MKALTVLDPPAAHAQAALDGINADPASFNMRSWMGLRNDRGLIRGMVELAPDQTPLSCGTTLCAAGWVAHNAGYALIRSGADSYVKGAAGEHLSVSMIAMDLLQLESEQAYDLFHAGEESAKYALELIARGVPADWETDEGSPTFYEWLWANGYGGKASD